MGCYNGSDHLQTQLDSIAAQTHTDWVLLASDDGSSDDTLLILERFRERFGEDRVRIRSGPGRGFVANFLAMACEPSFDADYYAFCDQDDVWFSNKLERALIHLTASQGPQPRLYCGRTRLVDARGRLLGNSRLVNVQPSFANALVQSFAGANTMVMDSGARLLFESAGDNIAAASHDWWAYLLVTGMGGTVIYDEVPTVAYRQHGANLQGDNKGLRARWARLMQLMGGRMRSWNRGHIDGLSRIREHLAPESAELLVRFSELHEARGLDAMRKWLGCGIRRERIIDNIAIMLAAATGRF